MDGRIPSPAQQRQLLRAHVNLGHPRIGEFCRALRNGRCRRGIVRWKKRHFHCPGVRRTIDAENSAGCGPAKVLPIQPGLRHRHGGSKKPARPRNPSTNLARHLSRDTFPPGRTQAGHDSRRNHYHTTTILAQALRCNGSFDHGPGFRIWCRLFNSCANSEVLCRW